MSNVNVKNVAHYEEYQKEVETHEFVRWGIGIGLELDKPYITAPPVGKLVFCDEQVDLHSDYPWDKKLLAPDPRKSPTSPRAAMMYNFVTYGSSVKKASEEIVKNISMVLNCYPDFQLVVQIALAEPYELRRSVDGTKTSRSFEKIEGESYVEDCGFACVVQGCIVKNPRWE